MSIGFLIIFYVRLGKICSFFPLQVQIENYRNQHMRRISEKDVYLPRKRPYHLCYFIVSCLFPLCDIGTGRYLYCADVHLSHALFFNLRITANHRQIKAFWVKGASSAKQKREVFICVLHENLLHNQIGTVWIYCHTMDNMNIKTVRFGCERHTGFRCAANCFLPLQQSQLRLRVLFASEHAQRVGIGKRDLSSAETDQRLTLHVFQNAGDGFARRVDLAGQLFVGDTYGRAAA